jgi:hypothetical protein
MERQLVERLELERFELVLMGSQSGYAWLGASWG